MWNYNFQDPASVYAYSLMYVHHQVMWYMIIILAIVYWSFYRIIKEYNWYSFNKQMGIYYSVLYTNNILKNLELFTICITFKLSCICMSVNKKMLFALLNNFNSKDLTKLLANWFADEKFNNNVVKNSYMSSIKELLDLKYYTYNMCSLTSSAYSFGSDKEYKNFLKIQGFKDNILLEYIWAIFPSLVIFLILIPSLYLLYSMEENISPKFNIKVIGHQWFWSYEFDSYDLSFEFDSNLIIENDLELGAKRLLEVDNRLYLPVNVPLRILVTSSDVLHSWAVPELGIKVDAVPGRLNDCITLIRRPGVFYGQCSELCGVGHGFMPIVVEACSYKQWLNKISQA